MGEGGSRSSRQDALERFLANELRLPLSTLSRLGARLASGSGDAVLVAVGRALARESERLDVLVTNALEFGLVAEPPGSAGEFVVAEVVEKAVTGQRAWIESLGVRVRVLDSSRDSIVRGDRDTLLQGLFALFSDLLERTPQNALIEIRMRDLLGLVRVDVLASRTTRATQVDRSAWVRVRERLLVEGGDLWDGDPDDGGFGFTLPRARAEAPLAVRRQHLGAGARR
ncbi:MAG: hypothetical protein EXS13_00955 [Planctomycetes bacterium]|nr:hypothetical protein [Planctomycetota bacterium]